MRRWSAELERREAVRTPKRLPCATWIPPDLDLARCRTHRDVERVGVQRARAHAEAAALFLTRCGGIEAMCCDPAPPRLPGPIHWTEQPYSLAAVLERHRLWRGSPARDPLTTRILCSLGRQGVREIALVPICVRKRLVGFLYADAGTAQLSDGSIAALSSICDGLAGAFEHMIVERKRGEAW